VRDQRDQISSAGKLLPLMLLERLVDLFFAIFYNSFDYATNQQKLMLAVQQADHPNIFSVLSP
jgi:hypothetical protein